MIYKLVVLYERGRVFTQYYYNKYSLAFGYDRVVNSKLRFHDIKMFKLSIRGWKIIYRRDIV